jgi:hypothetical protein
MTAGVPVPQRSRPTAGDEQRAAQPPTPAPRAWRAGGIASGLFAVVAVVAVVAAMVLPWFERRTASGALIAFIAAAHRPTADRMARASAINVIAAASAVILVVFMALAFARVGQTARDRA